MLETFLLGEWNEDNEMVSTRGDLHRMHDQYKNVSCLPLALYTLRSVHVSRFPAEGSSGEGFTIEEGECEVSMKIIRSI